MTDRQRALIAALVYTIKNKKYFNSHRIGVRRLPNEAYMYEFNGEILSNSIYLRDEKFNLILHEGYEKDPLKVKIKFIGEIGTERFSLVLPERNDFEGRVENRDHFEGRYYLNDDLVEIHDDTQDKDKYVYRIIW